MAADQQHRPHDIAGRVCDAEPMPQFTEMLFVVIQLGAILAVLLLFWNKLCPVSFQGKPYLKKKCWPSGPKYCWPACLPESWISYGATS